MSAPIKVLVIGGTGAQGQRIVKGIPWFHFHASSYVCSELVKDHKYLVTILTRSTETASAKALQELDNVLLIKGSYQAEEDLRKALKDQHGVYMNMDSFTMSEAAEYFWSFRTYELAVQAGVKHFVYSTVPNWPRARNYGEEYRAPHLITKGRVTEWLSAQPTSILPWTILVGSIYTEMLSIHLAPSVDPDGTFVFMAPTGDGTFPFTDLAQYGHFSRWIFDNPARSVGQQISLGVYPASLTDIATTFTKVTGKKARSLSVTIDQWFERETSRGYPIERKLPFNLAGGEDDDSRFTYRQRYTRFYNIWRTETPEEIKYRPNPELIDEICPPEIRVTSLEEWMRVTGYTGERKQILARDRKQPI